MIYSNLTTINEIEQQALDIISEFLQHAPFQDSSSLELECSFSKESGYPGLEHNAESDHSIRAVERDGTLCLTICSEDLLGIPVGALQGWLELKIVLAMIEADADAYQFNFQNQILPLMQLAGGALYFIRELVEHLSRGLKTFEATKIITGMNRGMPQVYYHFYTFNPTAESRELYKKLLPHNWSRANYLCRKMGGYLALAHLADNGVGFSARLFKDLKEKNSLTDKDQAFMDDMVLVAQKYGNSEFSFRLVEMFKYLKESLLVPSSDDANNSGFTG